MARVKPEVSCAQKRMSESTKRCRKLTVGARRRFQAKPERANTEQIPTRARRGLWDRVPVPSLLAQEDLAHHQFHHARDITHEHDQEQVKNTPYKAVQRVAPQETRGWPSRVVDGTAARAPRSPNSLPCVPNESTELLAPARLRLVGLPTLVDC